MPNAPRGAECAPLLLPSQLRHPTWSGWTRCRRSWLPGKGRPIRTCPTGEPSKTQGTRRASSGRCAAPRCEANAFGSNSSWVPPGHPGRRLPWGQRSSAPVAARSPGSRSQTRGRRSRLAPPSSAFPRGWIAAKRENHSLGPASSQPRFLFSPGRRHGAAQCRPSPLTRPTCLLSVWVKSLIHLPERPETAASQAGSRPASPM